MFKSRNYEYFERPKIFLFWITHPTRQLGALSKRDTKQTTVDRDGMWGAKTNIINQKKYSGPNPSEQQHLVSQLQFFLWSKKYVVRSIVGAPATTYTRTIVSNGDIVKITSRSISLLRLLCSSWEFDEFLNNCVTSSCKMPGSYLLHAVRYFCRIMKCQIRVCMKNVCYFEFSRSKIPALQVKREEISKKISVIQLLSQLFFYTESIP